MNLFPQHPAARAGAVLGFFAMAAIGWNLAGDPPANTSAVSENQVTQPASTDKLARSARTSTGPPEAVRKRLAGLRAIPDPGERMRATIELANTLPLSEISAWLDGRWFHTGGGFDLSLFNKILRERWQTEDPEGLVLWSMKNNSSDARSTLSSWAETDPQRFTDFFKQHPNDSFQLNLLYQIAKKNPAFAFECLLEIANSQPGETKLHSQEIIRQLASASPALLEAKLDALPANLKIIAESELIGQKLLSSFDTEIQKLLDRPDGWRILEANLSKEGLSDRLFAEMGKFPDTWRASMANNPYGMIGHQGASEKWVTADYEGLGFTDKQAKRMRSSALNSIANKNPENALKLMADIGWDGDEKRYLISNIFSRHGGDPEKTQQLLAALGSEEDRQAARDSISQSRESSADEKVETPAQLLQKISASNAQSSGYHSLFYNLRSWDPQKIGDLANQFAAMPANEKKQAAKAISESAQYAENIIRPLQADALRYLVANPDPPADSPSSPAANMLQSVSQFATNWGRSDPSAASDWVQSLPAGDAKSWAQKNLAANWVRYDPKEARQWIDSLPAAARAEVQAFLKTGGKP
jgi:hypothetical protein